MEGMSKFVLKASTKEFIEKINGRIPNKIATIVIILSNILSIDIYSINEIPINKK
jgi:hypothetical protein